MVRSAASSPFAISNSNSRNMRRNKTGSAICCRTIGCNRPPPIRIRSIRFDRTAFRPPCRRFIPEQRRRFSTHHDAGTILVNYTGPFSKKQYRKIQPSAECSLPECFFNGFRSRRARAAAALQSPRDFATLRSMNQHALSSRARFDAAAAKWDTPARKERAEALCRALLSHLPAAGGLTGLDLGRVRG